MTVSLSSGGRRCTAGGRPVRIENCRGHHAADVRREPNVANIGQNVSLGLTRPIAGESRFETEHKGNRLIEPVEITREARA